MRKALFITMIFFMSGCAMVQEQLKVRKPDVNFVNAHAHSFTLSSIMVDVKLDVTNPNPITVKADRIDLLLYINKRKTVKVMFNDINLPANKTEKLNATVKIPYKSVGTALVGVIKRGKVTYKLDGKIFVKTPVGMLDFPVTIYEKK
jgi:LEA14-like dessication related protein